MIQEIFLLTVAVIGYGLFLLFQNPRTIVVEQNVTGYEIEIRSFLIYLAAVAVTLCFWGLLSNLLSCIFRNMWMGIAGCLMLWLITNSSFGDRYFGAWNLFSYTFRDVENTSDLSWICGKIVCICVGMIVVAMLPKIIEKRG